MKKYFDEAKETMPLEERRRYYGNKIRELGEIVGRVGDSFKVRGMFVHDPQVKEVLAKIDGVAKGVLVIARVNQRDRLTFRVELEGESINKKHVSQRLEITFRDICRLKIDGIEFYSKGTIAPDEKALKDERKWD